MPHGIATLDQHESKRPDVNPNQDRDFRPTDKEEKIIKKINQLFERSREHRQRYDEKWVDFYHMFRGKQWKEERPPYRHSEVINMVFQNIQAMIPILTDSRPRFEFLPQNPEDQEVVAILNELSRDDWEKNSWLNVITEQLYDGHIYGTGFTETTYDQDLKDGLGGVVFKSKDPFYCYPDPDATDVNTESEYFIVAEPMSLHKIKKRWPSRGKFVKPDIDDFEGDEKADLGKIRFRSPTENSVAFESSTRARQKGRDRALVITCYLKDDSIITDRVKKEGDNGKEEEVEERRKEFPKGRRIILANKVILQDGPNPYDDGEFPYEKYSNYILPREFFGESEIAQLEGPQRIFNKMVSFALDVLTLTGNPIWILDSNSGVDASNIFNSPGLIVEKQPGTEVRREAGTQLQPYVLQLIDRMKSWFDDISGVNEVSRGAVPTGVQAGIAIQSLQDAAQTRIRQKSRNLDVALQKMGQHYLSRVLQFYTAPRVVRLTNNESAVKFFKLAVDIEKDEKGDLKRRDLIVVPFSENEQGRLVEGEQMRFDLIRNFDVRVQTGSALPFARAEKESKLLQFFDRGLIDREEVLKNSELPNWEAILKRITEREQAQQAAQQQQPQGA